MLVSTSAFDPHQYQWFKYIAKKSTVFSKHNRHYELELTTNLIYGYRKMKNKYRLILASDPEVFFNLSEDEITLLKKRAKPFVGKIQGKRVTAKEIVDDKLYHDMPVPPSTKDLERLYDHYNKKLFDGKCPPVKVAFTRDMKAIAKARMYWVERTSKISFSKAGLVSVKYITDTLLHEMIHCYQHHLLFKYWDDDREAWKTLMLEMRGKTKGHDVVFLREAHRLNALGYQIDVAETADSLMTNDSQWYALLFHNAKGDGYFGFTSDMPFDEKLDDFIEQMKKNLGPTFAHNWTYGKVTNNLFVTTHLLTKNQELPKLASIRWYTSKVNVQHSLEVEKSGELAAQADVTPLDKAITNNMKIAYEKSLALYGYAIAMDVVYDMALQKDALSTLRFADFNDDTTTAERVLSELFGQEGMIKVVTAWKNVNVSRFMQRHKKAITELVDDIWDEYQFAANLDYSDNARINMQYNRIIRLFARGELGRMKGNMEFKEAINKRVAKDFPIPMKAIRAIVDAIIGVE